MGAITIFALVACGFMLVYLYVMGMCYLCDVYKLKQERKRAEAEKRRRKQLRSARERAEKRRELEMERRKRLAIAGKRRGTVTPDRLLRERAGSKVKTPARA